MFTAIVLICQIGAAVCDLDHNVGRIPVEGEFPNAIECLRDAMTAAAAARPRIGEGAYPKITCMRWRPGNQG